MRNNMTPILKDIILVGGGHAQVTVLKQFGMQPIPGVRLTLISPDAHTPYSGMLPGLIAGHYTYDQTHIDLAPLCQMANARFYQTEVLWLDPVAKLVFCKARPPIPYDLLSINIGSTPDPSTTPGAISHVLPVKPVAQFLKAWGKLKARVLDNPKSRIGVVGAGAGGVEIALSAQFALRAMLRKNNIHNSQPTFHLMTSGSEILSTHNARVRNAFMKILNRRGIDVRTEFHVAQVDEDGICGPAGNLPLDEILWLTGAYPPSWIRASGLDVNERGFMAIDENLRATSHPEIFGTGDIAGIKNHPRPKSGVFAVRQGPWLAKNLRRVILNQPLATYRPQSEFLSLLSTGDKYAVASRGKWYLEGSWVWRWKDSIDRKFMTSFNELPDMPAPPKPDIPVALTSKADHKFIDDLAMRCGGCGAKVGASVLSKALSELQIIQRDDVIIGLDPPDDAAVISVPEGKLIVQTVDAFRTMINDPYTFGKIAANHCLGDIFAMGADPQSATAIATLPAGLPEKTEASLRQMMTGAVEVLNEANCALIGGHTAEGQELSLGFAITGLIDATRLTRKANLKSNACLILTKPIGTGVIFAAHMRAKAKGRWVQQAIETACHSNATAARILHEHGTQTVTDVTGFGLVGHLTEMLAHSENIRADINIQSVPLLEGAQQVVAAGIVSSLQSANLDKRTQIQNLKEVENNPRFPLLFDPQTAGGLLAGVPKTNAERCLKALRSAGYIQAAIIGHTTGQVAPGSTITITGQSSS